MELVKKTGNGGVKTEKTRDGGVSCCSGEDYQTETIYRFSFQINGMKIGM